MALEGSIKDFSLADIFQLIGIQRKTGVLTLQRKDEEVKVSFLNGLVVNADSRSKRLDDRLGTVLVKTGRLSPESLKKALKLQKDTLKKVGHILVEENMVRPEDLREALGIQVTQIIYRLFRWKGGDYHFEQDVPVDYDKENFAPMSAESILMEGMRMIDEWPIIERKIPSFEIIFEKVPLEGGAEPIVEEALAEDDGGFVEGGDGDSSGGDDFDRIFGADRDKKEDSLPPSSHIKLTREENVVYQQVNAEASVQDIIDRIMLSEFEVCRALFDLNNRNLIQPVAKAAKATAEVKKANVQVASHLAKAVYLVVALGVLAGSALSGRNPLNLMAPPAFRSGPLEALRSHETAAKVRRVAAAIDTYALIHRSYPKTSQDLLKDGLLGPADLRDPWGREIGFEVREDRIVISGRAGDSADAPIVSEERITPV